MLHRALLLRCGLGVGLTLVATSSTAATTKVVPTEQGVAKQTRGELPRARGTPASWDKTALKHLQRRAEEERSTALLVLHRGQLVVESYFGADPETASIAMSVSKSIVALAIGALVDEERVDLDAPLATTLVPEWQGRRGHADLTLRHLMSHTSGLPAERYGVGEDPTAWRTSTIEDHVLRASLSDPPGARFAYNNNAVDFLSVVARRADPERIFLDDTLHRRIFGPLRVHGAYWSKDGHGDPRGAGELLIRPIDLAKIGQLVLDGGEWQGRQLLSRRWMKEMLGPGQTFTDQCGLLWWRDGRPKAFFLNEHRLKMWAEADVDPAIRQQAKALLGRSFATLDDAKAALTELLGHDGLVALEKQLAEKRTRLFEQETEVLAYRADGWLGQYIVVVPSAQLVAVRMRDPRRTSWNPDELSYLDFSKDVLAVAGHRIP